MGRGSSKAGGGGKVGSGRMQTPPEYLAETEKAVKLTLIVEDFVFEDTKKRDVWVPKSQLAEDGRPSQWITRQKALEFYTGIDSSYSNYEAIWQDKAGKRFEWSLTKREEEWAKERAKRERKRAKERKKAFEKGKKEYAELVQKAKDMGVKGIRVGLKKKTILRKIREAESKR